jgi:hypothetical protein
MSEDALGILIAVVAGLFIVAISILSVPPPKKRRW